MKKDIVILGGGAAGLTAALYAARDRYSVVLIEKLLCGGQAASTDNIENYPGFPDGINGLKLMGYMQKQAEKFGVDIVYDEVQSIRLSEKQKTVTTSGAEYESDAFIISTGADYRKLSIPGEEKYTGRGVSYCATCDGAFFKDKEIVVVGGGDTALDEALYLTQFASKITIVHRRSGFRATKIIQEQVLENKKIQTIMNSAVTAINGEQSVNSIVIKDLKKDKEYDFATSGIFIFIGLTPNTELFKGTVDMDKSGYLLANSKCETNIAGVFAAGDCIQKELRQVITAAADGAIAAFSARGYINKLRGFVYK